MRTKFFYFTPAVLATLVITGCRKKEGSETSEQPSTSAPAATVDPSTAGPVTGTVTLDGTPPVLRPINMSADPYCQKAHSGPVVPAEVVTGEKGVLANVVVYLKSGLGDYSFARGEHAIPVKCNVHPWMKSYIFVFKNPYFGVTSKVGAFELENLPPGTYTIGAWQEKYSMVEQTVTIEPKESKAISLTFKAAGSSGD